MPEKVGRWLRDHSRGAAITAAIVVLAAVVQIVNGLPEFFDDSLPWLGSKVNLGEFATTVWQLAWVAPLVVALILLFGIYRATSGSPIPAGRPPDVRSEAPREKAPEAPQEKSDAVRFRVHPGGSLDGVALRVINDGPTGTFAGVVTDVSGPHMESDVEPRDLPWGLIWQGATDPPTIGPGQSAVLQLVRFDKVAAQRLVGHQARSAPFIFPSTTGDHGIFGRLRIGHVRDLRSDPLRVSVRIWRIEVPSEVREGVVCIRFGVGGEWCD